MVLNVLKVWCCRFRNNEERFAKHELLIKAERVRILRELVPHGSDDRYSCKRGLAECRVEVVRLCVSLIDCVSNHFLDSWRTKPWLAVLETVDAGMGSEEGIEDSRLVLLDELIVIWNT